MSELKSSTVIFSEVAVFVAVSVGLSYVKVFSLPQGGSVTAGSMVPMIWLALRRGAKVGLFASAIYGLVQLVVEPFVFHPAQVLLDYPLAFGALGLAGFFSKRKLLGRRSVIADHVVATALSVVLFVLFSYELAHFRLAESVFFAWIFAFSVIFLLWLGVRGERGGEAQEKDIAPALIGAGVGIFGRFLAHLVSGIVFFGSFAPEGMSPIVYSAFYNGSYLVPELLVSAYLVYLLAKSGMIEIYS
ncbi:MAG: energy-coupled thiamine transporter ThiT [Candidatus Bathyarchaeota archaeon]|nr:energy-coupled thiamine transporter ThiT [Candidatus Bathyarchaeota archaeon]